MTKREIVYFVSVTGAAFATEIDHDSEEREALVERMEGRGYREATYAQYMTNWWARFDRERAAALPPSGPSTAEALALLWRAATRDPYCGDMAKLVEARRVLEQALGHTVT